MAQVEATFAEPHPVPTRTAAFTVLDVPPLVIIAAITILELTLNRWVQLRWIVPTYKMIWPSLICLAVAIFYFGKQREAALSESWLYLGLWLFYPVFVAQLTFIVARAGFPLQDKLFLASDAALGFHWTQWARFCEAHPAFLKIQSFVYGSFFWQPLITVPVLAFWGPRGRNGEFLTAILLGICIVTITFTFLPTIGPADMGGIKALQGELIRELRSGFRGPYIYYGVISFPSFHTAMAILCTTAHRGNRITFPIVLTLNLLMLSAIPFWGDHYLSDLIAGSAIAVFAIWASHCLQRHLKKYSGRTADMMKKNGQPHTELPFSSAIS